MVVVVLVLLLLFVMGGVDNDGSNIFSLLSDVDDKDINDDEIEYM